LNEETKEIYYDTAFIPDFNTSVMMNKLFRKIKENDRLDALEESDDEEEFENENEDQFVYLDKTYNMICLYNHKFKKWYPIKIADTNMVITNISNLKSR
jgi:DNA repair photolyase